jgi:hypothetical protein
MKDEQPLNPLTIESNGYGEVVKALYDVVVAKKYKK